MKEYQCDISEDIIKYFRYFYLLGAIFFTHFQVCFLRGVASTARQFKAIMLSVLLGCRDKEETQVCYGRLY